MTDSEDCVEDLRFKFELVADDEGMKAKAAEPVNGEAMKAMKAKAVATVVKGKAMKAMKPKAVALVVKGKAMKAMKAEPVKGKAMKAMTAKAVALVLKGQAMKAMKAKWAEPPISSDDWLLWTFLWDMRSSSSSSSSSCSSKLVDPTWYPGKKYQSWWDGMWIRKRD